MMLFRDLTDDVEGFKDFEQKRIDDDEKTKRYFDKCDHGEFISSILHLGVLLDSVAVYFDFLEDQIQEALQSPNITSKKRKINKFIRDINTKINTEYDFDDKTIIVEDVVLFDGQLYLFFSKTHFLKTMDLKDINE